VILLHPLVLHVATPNTSKAPRFLLSGGVDLPSMWTASLLREIDTIDPAYYAVPH
jgi:hypothetical protein